MTGYSALFSAGLLAPYHAHAFTPLTKDTEPQGDDHWVSVFGDACPIRPLSPMLVSDESDDMDDDDDDDEVSSYRRDVTPTQQSVRAAAASLACSTMPPPSLRKRRSSLSLNVNGNPIRSPIRTAGVAMQLQRALGSRSRSGSVTAPTSASNGALHLFGGNQLGIEGASLMGRMRTGSLGSRPLNTLPSRLVRRQVRRTASVPAAMPPPTAPLPALPPMAAPNSRPTAGSRPPLVAQNNEVKGPYGNATKPKMPTRDRGLSVSSTVERIDEEMKEN